MSTRAVHGRILGFCFSLFFCLGVGVVSAPAHADVIGIDHGHVTAINPEFNSAGDCRVTIQWEGRVTTVDFPYGKLSDLCNGTLFLLQYIVVPVKDRPVVCAGDICSTFVATGAPVNTTEW